MNNWMTFGVFDLCVTSIVMSTIEMPLMNTNRGEVFLVPSFKSVFPRPHWLQHHLPHSCSNWSPCYSHLRPLRHICFRSRLNPPHRSRCIPVSDFSLCCRRHFQSFSIWFPAQIRGQLESSRQWDNRSNCKTGFKNLKRKMIVFHWQADFADSYRNFTHLEMWEQICKFVLGGNKLDQKMDGFGN